MLVTISSATTGTCIWCCKRDEDGVVAKFKDGLQGHFCWKDFRAAVKARSNGEEGEGAPSASSRGAA